MLVYEPTELFAETSITWSWLLAASPVGLSPSCLYRCKSIQVRGNLSCDIHTRVVSKDGDTIKEYMEKILVFLFLSCFLILFPAFPVALLNNIAIYGYSCNTLLKYLLVLQRHSYITYCW